MHNKYRQVVEQRRIVDAHHHRGAARRAGQRFDHAADQLQTVVAGRSHPRSQGAQRKSPRRIRGNHPPDCTAIRFSRVHGLAGDPALAHPRGPAHHNPAAIPIRQCGFNEPHLLRSASQRPPQPHAGKNRSGHSGFGGRTELICAESPRRLESNRFNGARGTGRGATATITAPSRYPPQMASVPRGRWPKPTDAPQREVQISASPLALSMR